MRRKVIPVLAALTVAVVVAGTATAVSMSGRGGGSRTISAVFSETPALYPGNHVDVLGMPVGSVTAVHAGPTGVVVTMRVDDTVTIPAGAGAYLVAPNVVNDRYVELSPAYTGGPSMAPGTTIPQARTHVPLSVDAVLADLDSLFKALAPTVSDPKGALASLVADLDKQLAGQGPALNSTIMSLGSAATGLNADGPNLAKTIDNLSPFVAALAGAAHQYQAFTGNLAGASTVLNADRSELASTLSTLQQVLAQLATFVQANAGHLGSTLHNLGTAAAAVAAKQHDLARAVQVGGLALQNLDAAIYKQYPAYPNEQPYLPFLETRVNFDGAAVSLSNSLCGSNVLRTADLLVGAVPGADGGKSPASSAAASCLFDVAAANIGAPPGDPTTANATYAGLLAAAAR
ncbi:MCE family protein [Acidiferrimicrobium sp. IK]|uniref:MCE family protein n=1 Tax=Acidiferrimicrobium sp. IK TaxID=2871700 RepID=UPI0021CB346F|nr:MCE family protein [Acidiferrimicrobium sp. IK]MCU4187492.1 MCE family protein [Acidiferrimicrobium sp. IK]